jgi:hypothetical protein
LLCIFIGKFAREENLNRFVASEIPCWLDLSHGVRVFVRPLDVAACETARAESCRLGIPGEVVQLRFAQALARAAIIRWEGVLDESGGRAEVTGRTVDELMQVPGMAEGIRGWSLRPDG